MPTSSHVDQAKKKPAKQFVAHGRHNRSSSSTRLAQNAGRQRLVPLTGADEASQSPSEYEDPRARMKRSKSTDAILRKDKRLTPLKMTKSHTRLHKPTVGMTSAVKATGRGAVMQLGGGSDTEDDEDQADDSPKASSSSNQLATPVREMEENDLTPPPQRPSVSKSSSQDSLPPTHKPKAAPPKINHEIVFATTQEKSNPFYGDSIAVKGPGKALRPSLDRTVSASHTTRTQQKLWLQRESMDQRPTTHITPEQRKEFERISKEYLSVCRYYAPIADCIKRIKEERQKNEAPRKIKDRRDELATGLSQSLPKRVNSLSATMLSSQGSPNTWHAPPGAEQSVDNITQLLNKLWSEPYNNPDDSRQVNDAQPSIGLQAQRAQQNLTAGRTARGPNGGLRLG